MTGALCTETTNEWLFHVGGRDDRSLNIGNLGDASVGNLSVAETNSSSISVGISSTGSSDWGSDENKNFHC